MLRLGIERLELNHTLGFAANDIRPIEEFSFVRGFEIIHRQIRDISPVHALTNLHNLSIQTHCRTEIRCGAFPHLTHCRVLWRPGAQSVFSATSLEALFLDSYCGADLDPVSGLIALHTFYLGGSRAYSLAPLASLPRLRKVGLFDIKHVRRLDPIAAHGRIEVLEIDGAKALENVEPLAALRGLRILMLCNVGRIPSLCPLAGLPQLEHVFFWEDTDIVDGDVSVLLTLPRLRQVAFRNRRHYNRRSEEIQTELERRHGKWVPQNLETGWP